MFYNSFFFATQCRRPYIFQTMNSVGPKKFEPAAWIMDIGI